MLKKLSLTQFTLVALIVFSSLGFGDNSQVKLESPFVTGIAPSIILHSISGKQWSSLDYVGKKPLRIILIGATPHIETLKDNQLTIEIAIAQAAREMRQSDIEVVTAIQPQFFPDKKAALSQKFLNRAKDMNLHYADDAIYKQFSVSPNGITLVAIDKAGFLRQVEKLPVSSAIGDALIRSTKMHSSLELGNAAPDFSILLENKRKWRLADFRGREKVLLLFMPAEMTCGCQNPIPILQAKQLGLDKSNVEVLIISSNKETTEKLIGSNITRFDFATDNHLNLHYLYYGGQDLTDALTVLIDKNGIAREITEGSDPVNFKIDVINKIISLE